MFPYILVLFYQVIPCLESLEGSPWAGSVLYGVSVRKEHIWISYEDISLASTTMSLYQLLCHILM